jgi:hypothetical protein
MFLWSAKLFSIPHSPQIHRHFKEILRVWRPFGGNRNWLLVLGQPWGILILTLMFLGKIPFPHWASVSLSINRDLDLLYNGLYSTSIWWSPLLCYDECPRVAAAYLEGWSKCLCAIWEWYHWKTGQCLGIPRQAQTVYYWWVTELP